MEKFKDWHKKEKGDTHYPVPGNFTVGKRASRHRELTVFYIWTLQMQWIKVAVDGKPGMLHQSMCVEIARVMEIQYGHCGTDAPRSPNRPSLNPVDVALV